MQTLDQRCNVLWRLIWILFASPLANRKYLNHGFVTIATQKNSINILFKRPDTAKFSLKLTTPAYSVLVCIYLHPWSCACRLVKLWHVILKCKWTFLLLVLPYSPSFSRLSLCNSFFFWADYTKQVLTFILGRTRRSLTW